LEQKSLVRACTAWSPGYFAEASPSTIVVTARQSCFSLQGTFTDPSTVAPWAHTIQTSFGRPVSRSWVVAGRSM
jgi:hypothetical protein